MELLHAMQTMNACRYYKPDPVADDVLARVLNAARWAATGSNIRAAARLARNIGISIIRVAAKLRDGRQAGSSATQR